MGLRGGAGRISILSALRSIVRPVMYGFHSSLYDDYVIKFVSQAKRRVASVLNVLLPRILTAPLPPP